MILHSHTPVNVDGICIDGSTRRDTHLVHQGAALSETLPLAPTDGALLVVRSGLGQSFDVSNGFAAGFDGVPSELSPALTLSHAGLSGRTGREIHCDVGAGAQRRLIG